MNWPLAAVSVSDFWGRRWNTAFRDLTHRFLFRPLTRLLGPRWALLIGFVFSGLLHDLVISWPARGGYGGPTLFFLLQSLAIFVERSGPGRRLGLGKGWPGWLFTTLVLLVPVSGLFHPPFVREIMVPFLRAIGGIR
jgi:alginate O-acetyltransferase complex protein AlgI